MERNINYTVDLSEIHPKSPQYGGVQGEHNETAIKISFSEEFKTELQKLPHFYEFIQFRIDYTDSLGNVIYGEVKDIGEITEPFYLTRAMTKQGGNATAVLKICCSNQDVSEKEFFTGVMRFYFDSCPSVILSDDEQGSVLSPIVNQARIYRNEAYDCAKVATDAENSVQKALNVVEDLAEIGQKVDTAAVILSQCEEATDLARDAANGVVTIEQNRQRPLKISVMTKEEYAAAQRPDSEGATTLDFIEDECLADLIYPVGSIYMSVNATDPAMLFGGYWERIKDRFLLSCGNDFSAGSIGGEEMHTLTESEMPAHTHDTLYATNNGTGGTIEYLYATGITGAKPTSGRDSVLTSSQGGNAAHNNMPPYLAVYMWQRIS